MRRFPCQWIVFYTNDVSDPVQAFLLEKGVHAGNYIFHYDGGVVVFVLLRDVLEAARVEGVSSLSSTQYPNFKASAGGGGEACILSPKRT